MKLISRIFAGCVASVAVLGLAAPDARAAHISYAGNYTYLDAFVPGGSPYDASFDRGGIAAGGTVIDDYWIFDVNPDADGQVSINFLPIGTGISGFMGGFYHASGFVGCVSGAVCAAPPGVIGALIAEGPQVITGVAGFVPAGQYAIRVQGTTTGVAGGVDRTYTGQILFEPAAVPEPATMALFGLGLLGAGFARRRRS